MAMLKNITRALVRRPALALIAVVAAAGITTVALWPASAASAHCDSVDGPVATAAYAALEKGDVTLVLPYVKAEQEQELTTSFEQTMNIRKRGPQVREFADRYFVETAVRLHRGQCAAT